ncbi:MAG TPA: hypothetical protein DEA90_07590 [Opitutae bacterium]|nr:hypothetical protein [Puniceicoccaceae bacterium]HBR94014.1 hypothetical protein [Opitutae bacterium]|tara:strand:- start:315 stop:629 length:315 start_codon:yes stop_codon:yes gene_type:complete
MTITRDEWNQNFEASASSNEQYYVSAFLLTYYFLHLSDDVSGQHLRRYIESWQQDRNHAASSQRALTQLMQGQSYQELQASLIAAYARQGLELTPYHGMSLQEL